MGNKPPIQGDIKRLTTADNERKATASARDGICIIDCFGFEFDHELEVIELAALSGLDWSKLMQAMKRLCLLGYLEPTTGQTYRLSPRMFPAGGWGRTPRVYRAYRK
jgi:DNA-binding IclR family transcriptional regulator